MKWDFFYDEGDNKPYESIQDWRKDISHLIVPTGAIVILGIVIYICLRYFYI